jgi:hypothetical protein
MNSALMYALYILVCKELGHEAKMPINQIYWNGTDNSSYAPLIADLTIFASTNPKCANEAFNIVNGDYFCWKYVAKSVGLFRCQGQLGSEIREAVPNSRRSSIGILIC